ncbi:MAG: hypothetical protein NVSMB65_08200 [Chloroflexota bacterium]
MTLTPRQTSPPVIPATAPRRNQQLQDLRFLETLQATLAGCGDEAAVYGAATHRVASAFDALSACLAIYDPVADTLTIAHGARAKRAWELDLLMQAVTDERTVSAGDVIAAPILCGDGLCVEGRTALPQRPWGVLAIARPAAEGAASPAMPGEQAPQKMAGGDLERQKLRAAADRISVELERQKLRAAAERIGAELERRRVFLLDDVLDGLLRKTKPIDVYTHALRELRRFIRYDHSASIMTMERGIPQITVRVEKVVQARGDGETLVDSPRRAHSLRLTPAQARYLGRLETAVELTNEREGWHLAGGAGDPDAAGLWRVLCLGGDTDAMTPPETAILFYPLTFGGKMLGILRLAARRPGAFHAPEQYTRLLDRFARLLSVTLYRSELYYQSDRQLRAIKEMGRAITQPMGVEEVCRHVLSLALRVLHVQAGAVGLLAEEGTLQIVAHHGCTRERPPTLAPGVGISGTVVQTGRSWAVPDVTREHAYVVFNDRVRSELVVPITYDQEVIGFLDVASFEEGRFREEDEEVITFLEALANQTAIAVRTAQLRTQAVEGVGASMALDPELTTVGLYQRIIEELRATNERLVQASRAKSEFLANMSHELRTPLNAIIGFSNLLLNPQAAANLDEDDRRQSLEDIRSSGRHLLTLINDILDLSKVEAGKVRLTVAPFPARPALDNVRTVAETLATEGAKNLEITVTLAPEITTIRADESKFRQIMDNLVSNAVKFTPPGGRVTIEARTDPDGSLLIMVQDTGIGIAAEHHERIFEAFQQIDSSASRQYAGTGLGLALVRQLVGLHGGRTWVASSPGAGSTFYVLLPQALR